jgi:hypothetical protein
VTRVAKGSVDLADALQRFHIASEIDVKLAEVTKQRARLLHERSNAQIEKSIVLLAESRRALRAADETLRRQRNYYSVADLKVTG